MRAAILAIGDELLGGRCQDTNSTWLSARLVEHGVTVVEIRSVGDDQARIVEALQALLVQADLVITTGGLGPTRDDLTREAAADLLEEPLVDDDHAREWIASHFRRRDLVMGPSQERLATRPRSATCWRNTVGTAPSIQFPVGESIVWLLPGPPVEMRDAWSGHLEPWLSRSRGDGPVTASITVKAFGLIEAEFEDRLGDLTHRDHRPRMGTRVSLDEFLLHVDPLGLAVTDFNPAVIDARERLQPYVFGHDSDTLSQAVGTALLARGETLAVAESCTGGGVGSSIVDVPGSSQWFRGGWITYSNEMKQQCLGVPAAMLDADGAVSEPVVAAMATAAARNAGTDWALSVSGIAGPDGGTADKPVGTVWIGCHGPTGVIARAFRLGTDRNRIRMRSIKMALQVLRWSLLDIDPMTTTSWDAP